MSALGHMYDNAEKYKNILALAIIDSNEGDGRFQQLSIMGEPDRARIVSSVHTEGTNRRLDLVYPATPDKPGEYEEIVLKTQGFIAQLDLPPVTEKFIGSKHLRSMRQRIVITGLGLESFEKDASAIIAIHKVLDSQLPVGVLQPWAPSTEQGHLCLAFSNRYFSSSEEADGRAGQPIDKTIDPFGVLANANVKGVHTEDNVVMYFERRIMSNKRVPRYIPIPPTAIRLGYMVELQVGFAAIPINKGRYIMLPKLRSVCIINRCVEDDINAKLIANMKSGTVTNKLKRTVGYSNIENVSDTGTETARQSFKRLCIDSDEERMTEN